MLNSLILLHPFPFDSRVLCGLSAELSALGVIDVLTPELVGRGLPSLDELGDLVIAAMDRAGAGRAVVGGVSMGGYVALNVLRRHPGRVAGLVLIDSKAAGDTPAARQHRLAIADRADLGEKPATAPLIAGMVSPMTAATRPDLIAQLAAIVDVQPASDIAWKQRAMAARPDGTDLLARCGLPLLVIAGADDTITPPDDAQQCAATVPGASFVRIPDVGHLAVAEDPTAVATALTNWWPRG